MWTNFEVAIVIRAHPDYCHRSHIKRERDYLRKVEKVVVFCLGGGGGGHNFTREREKRGEYGVRSLGM